MAGEWGLATEALAAMVGILMALALAASVRLVRRRRHAQLDSWERAAEAVTYTPPSEA